MDYQQALKLLGLDPLKQYSSKEIKRAYRELAKLTHPDASIGRPTEIFNHAEERMKLLNEAYDFAQRDFKSGAKPETGSVRTSASELKLNDVLNQFAQDLLNPTYTTIMKLPKQDVGLLTVLVNHKRLIQDEEDHFTRDQSSKESLSLDTWVYIGEYPSGPAVSAWRIKRILNREEGNIPLWKRKDQHVLVIEQNIEFARYQNTHKGPIWRNVDTGEISSDTVLVRPESTTGRELDVPLTSPFIGIADYVTKLNELADIFVKQYIPEFAPKIENRFVRDALRELYGLQDINKESPWFARSRFMDIDLGSLTLETQNKEGRIRFESPLLGEGSQIAGKRL